MTTVVVGNLINVIEQLKKIPMKLIDKDSLVAEIENLENTYKKCPTRNSYEDGLKDGRLIGYKDALHKIDTLEVKEVQEEPKDKCKGCNNVKGCITCVDGSEWAHYEEFKAQKGEEV